MRCSSVEHDDPSYKFLLICNYNNCELFSDATFYGLSFKNALVYLMRLFFKEALILSCDALVFCNALVF